MKRKHTKRFLLVSVATTLVGCGGSTDDGTDRRQDREASSQGASEAEEGNATPMPVGSMATPNYTGGPPMPATAQTDIPLPGVPLQPEPFIGDPVEPEYLDPPPGGPALPQYGGAGGETYAPGAGAGPIDVGTPALPAYGGAGGDMPFPGEPVEPAYGGAGGAWQGPGGAAGSEAVGGAGGTYENAGAGGTYENAGAGGTYGNAGAGGFQPAAGAGGTEALGENSN